MNLLLAPAIKCKSNQTEKYTRYRCIGIFGFGAKGKAKELNQFIALEGKKKKQSKRKPTFLAGREFEARGNFFGLGTSGI